MDAVNHPTRHTDIYNALNDMTLKKLLVRVDARRHHEDLFKAPRSVIMFSKRAFLLGIRDARGSARSLG